MNFIPQWAPNVHPMLVHFPIAIFFFAVLMDFLNFFLPERWWNERGTMITYVIGVISVVVVYFSGMRAESTIHHLSGLAQHAVDQHQIWALRTLWFFVLYTLVRLYLFFTQKVQRQRWHLIMLLISLGGLFLLYKTGEKGGKLVYKYRVNREEGGKSAISGMKREGTAANKVKEKLILKDFDDKPDTLQIPAVQTPYSSTTL
jgi:uncharacterized membrane protein